MKCSYTLTEAEVVKAMQVHGRGSNRKITLLVLIGVGFILLGFFTEFKELSYGAAIGGVAGYFAVLFLLIPFNAKKQYRQNRAVRSEMSMDFSEEGVVFKAETGESRLFWCDIHKWKCANDIYLLYITSNMFHMIPARALTNENKVTDLLSAHIGPKST